MFELAPVEPQANPLAVGVVSVEAPNEIVAAIFARNGPLMATQLAPILRDAARDRVVTSRIEAMGPTPRFIYSVGKASSVGDRFDFPVKIFSR